MFEYLKKSLLTGVGLALRSKNEIEELAKELANQSQMSQDEAKEFIKDCHQKYEAAKTDFDEKIEGAIERILSKLDLPSKSDLNVLNERIDDLTKKLVDQK